MSSQDEPDAPDRAQPAPTSEPESKSSDKSVAVREFGGPKGLEPTRYGDWEKQGRCIDF